MISTAYLRVYVDADGAEEMPRAEDVAGELPIRSDGRFIWNEPLSEDAFSTKWNGVEYVCPRNTRLRMVEGALAFSATYPRIPLIDDDERESFKSELAGLRAGYDGQSNARFELKEKAKLDEIAVIETALGQRARYSRPWMEQVILHRTDAAGDAFLHIHVARVPDQFDFF